MRFSALKHNNAIFSLFKFNWNLSFSAVVQATNNAAEDDKPEPIGTLLLIVTSNPVKLLAKPSFCRAITIARR